MKQKVLTDQTSRGFTLVELLVVIAIMGAVLGLMMVNFAAQRGPRDLRLAQRQLVTDLRKVQSYTLSSRNIPNTQAAAKFYIVKFNKTAQTQYEIQAVDANYNFISGVETSRLPPTIALGGGLNAFQLFRSDGTEIQSISCVQVAFALPFGRVFMDENCGFADSNNTSNPAFLAGLANRKLIISLQDSSSGQTKSVTVYGISGRIEGN